MAPTSYTRIVFAEQPKGAIDSNTFRIEEAPFDLKPANDEVLLKINYLSIDPAMRLWINDAEGNYVVLVQVGETMRSVGIATVIEAGADSGFSVGDRVSGQVGTYAFICMGRAFYRCRKLNTITLGLNEYSVVKAKPLVKVEWVPSSSIVAVRFQCLHMRFYSLPKAAQLLDYVGPLGHPGMSHLFSLSLGAHAEDEDPN